MKVKDLPVRIQDLLKAQTSLINLDFDKDRDKNKPVDTYTDAVLGIDATGDMWNRVKVGDFRPFYKRYGFDGDIKGFPYDVVMAMCNEQVKQGNEWSVEAFEYLKNSRLGGFHWGSTKQGWEFWEDVIVNEKFHLILQPNKKDTSVGFSFDDFKTGMIAVLRDGSEHKVACNPPMFRNESSDFILVNGGTSSTPSTAYDKNLNHIMFSKMDIVKIYMPRSQTAILSMRKGDLVWERKKPLELTLEDVARKFGVHKVKIVKNKTK